MITRNTVITLKRVLKFRATLDPAIKITITIEADNDDDAKRFEHRAKAFLDRELGE